MRIGINGFGRIGRLVTRAAIAHPNAHVVAINVRRVEVATIWMWLSLTRCVRCRCARRTRSWTWSTWCTS